MKEFASDASDERNACEHPEQAYRRGYQQGAHEVYQALKEADVLPPRLDEKLRRFIYRRIYRWRFESRRRLRRHIRKDVAPRFKMRGVACKMCNH
jgi:hypothetical protein